MDITKTNVLIPAHEYNSEMAPDQVYTKAYLKKLREEDLVIYDGTGCYAVKIIPRENIDHPLFEILGEDDGFLFSMKRGATFDIYWTDALIKQLNDAKMFWEKNKKKIHKKYMDERANADERA